MTLQVPCRKYAAVDKVDPEGVLALHIGSRHQLELVEML